MMLLSQKWELFLEEIFYPRFEFSPGVLKQSVLLKQVPDDSMPNSSKESEDDDVNNLDSEVTTIWCDYTVQLV